MYVKTASMKCSSQRNCNAALTEHEKNVRLRNRDRAIMPLSVTTDEDMEVWLQWLQEAVADHLPGC